jgi:uncharacterized protein (UPF0332 family)
MATKFDALLFLDVANKLKENPFSNKEEACFRTSVGRIYYSAYLFIRDKLHSLGKRYEMESSSSGGVHERLINYLKIDGDVQWRFLGRLLEELKELRTSVDYELESEIEMGMVDVALEKFRLIKLQLQKIGWW